MDSGEPGIQYVPARGSDEHDDNMYWSPDGDKDLTNGIEVPCAGPPEEAPAMAQGVRNLVQVRPNLGDRPEERRIQLWAAAGHGDGEAIAGLSWDVFRRNGALQAQLQGTRLTRGECGARGASGGPEASMFHAAVHTGQLSPAAVDDPDNGFVAGCLEEKTAVYYAEFPLGKYEVCGPYEIRATAVADGGATATLVSYIDVVCVFAMVIDFNRIDWGAVTPGVEAKVTGDFSFDGGSGANPPTIMNIGNDGMALKVQFSAMAGRAPNHEIDAFEGRFGRSDTALLATGRVPADTWANFGPGPGQVLCADELGRLDLSVYPPQTLAPGAYEGVLRIKAIHAHAKCFGGVHK